MSDSSEIKIEPAAARAAEPEMKHMQSQGETGVESHPQPETSPQLQSEPERAELAGAGSAMAEPVKKPKKRRRLKVAHPERCIGCLSCMFACSRIHTGRVSLIDSAIKIKTRGGIEGDFMVVVCRGCQDPPCVRACPAGALERRPDGSVRLNKELCTKCGKCADACLIGAITLGKEGTPIKCQHCGACVAFCPHGVLELEEVAA